MPDAMKEADTTEVVLSAEASAGAPQPADVPTESGEQGSQAEASVGGVPRSLLQSVLGMSVLLMLLGVVCELYAYWDSQQGSSSWQHLLLIFLAVPLLLSVGHFFWVRRRSAQVLTVPFFVFLGVNTLVLPALVILPSVLLMPAGPFLALAYSLAFLWYGAFYESSAAVSASCALSFTSVLSIPLLYGLSMISSGLVLIAIGLIMLYLVRRLIKQRSQKLGLREVAIRRQELSKLNREDKAAAPNPPDDHTRI